MGERPVTAPLEEGDLLLATKLYVPRQHPGFVSRPRLLKRLNAELTRGFIVVSAPAGFGKTALLADWVRSSQTPVAWLTLDTDDNDPARFWRHVAAALDRVHPGIAERVVPFLGPPAPPSFDGAATALINGVSATSGQVVLLLDDYQLVDSPQIHASVTFLFEHLPPGLCLVLAGRSEPPLALARARARGRLAELRAEDLRFTGEEATALLRAALGRDLPAAAVAALATRTEGWAAGLQLAALSLRGEVDVAEFVATFSGSHRYVLDYLVEEVLERQPEPTLTFLLETSVLDRLSGELCDAVTGRTDGQAMLEALERANLFLVPLDEVRGWWRYHQLFADLLRARLQLAEPGRAPQLHRNAAVWCEQHGLADHAVRHALGSGDLRWSAQLIERHVDGLLLRSEGATVRQWINALPPDLIGSRPRLLLAQARLALLSGRLEAADVALGAAERAVTRAPGLVDEPYEPSIGRSASLLANIPANIAIDRAYLAELRGSAENARAFASRALGEIAEEEWMLEANARAYLALAEWLRGRLEEAERAFTSSVAQFRAHGERYLVARTCVHLSHVQRAEGRLDAAVETMQQALEISAPARPPALTGAGIGHVGLAELAYQRGDLDTALQHLTDGVPLCRQLAYAQPLATGLATLAWIRQVQGDADAALDAMNEAEQVAPADMASLLNPVPAQRARLLLAQGDVAAAARWTEERRLDACDEPPYAREPEYLVLARVLLARDRPDQALALLARLLAIANEQGRIGSVIELQALQALALAARGEEGAALAVLADSLGQACPQGYVRVFADEGAPMGALLGRMVAAQRTEDAGVSSVPLRCLARLLQAFDDENGPPRPTRGATGPVSGLVEPLTARELEVLQLIATGRSNQGIAQELVVTLDTVKKHVSHILDKLGAANRTEAVARARDLGLIQ